MNDLIKSLQDLEPDSQREHDDINHTSLGIVKLSGTVQDFKSTHAQAEFFFKQSAKNAFGVVAIASSIAGMGGSAVLNASYAANGEEEADYLEFTLDGKPCKGWVWRSPFNEGDVVDVACEWQDNHYELYAITRLSDQVIALHPHCSRGKVRHIRNAVKWWLYINIIFDTPCLFFLYFLGWDFVNQIRILLYGFMGLWVYGFMGLWVYGFMGVAIFFAIVVFSMTRQWLPFVYLAEKCFKVLELPNPSNIDLVESTLGKSWESNPLYIVGETVFFVMLLLFGIALIPVMWLLRLMLSKKWYAKVDLWVNADPEKIREKYKNSAKPAALGTLFFKY